MNSQKKFSNALIGETSPYLLQHAYNPVNWQPWGDKALNKAKNENKPIIISIGYAACHWCHVMEHESFEDESVAKIMNENFVCIKVDREERPDVDQVYMQAVQLLSGRGGWPLNCFALPDSRPFYGGTYFPKENWKNLLLEIARLFQSEYEKVAEQATKLTNGVKKMDLAIKNQTKEEFDEKLELNIWQNWQKYLDTDWGGRAGAPKFPMPTGLNYLISYAEYNKDNNLLNAIELQLDRMALGGIYDQVGGGFSRYSVDERWHVPHFEKMLYDNGQLISVYSRAYRKFNKSLYKEIVDQSIVFIESEMMDQSGGFYASLDADSEGEEGKFYVWTKEEIEKLFPEDTELVKAYFNIDGKAFWEKGNNVLFITSNDVDFANQNKLSIDEWKEKKAAIQNKMLEERNKRVRPALDDKILTSWNALQLKGLTEAYLSFGNENHLNLALKNALFIIDKMKTSEGGLWRNFKNGNSSITAFLDDYAFTIDAFIGLYQCTFEENWLIEAKDLLEYTLSNFYDDDSGMFFYTDSNSTQLVARKMELSDNVIPASNSQMGINLFLLGSLFDNKDYLNKSKQMLRNMLGEIENGAAYYSNWALLFNYFLHPPFEIAILGPDWKAKKQELTKHALPNALFMGGNKVGQIPLLQGKLKENETYIYVCIDKTCQLPVKDASEALKKIL